MHVGATRMKPCTLVITTTFIYLCWENVYAWPRLYKHSGSGKVAASFPSSQQFLLEKAQDITDMLAVEIKSSNPLAFSLVFEAEVRIFITYSLFRSSLC